jgi:hypothetical protein
MGHELPRHLTGRVAAAPLKVVAQFARQQGQLMATDQPIGA